MDDTPARSSNRVDQAIIKYTYNSVEDSNDERKRRRRRRKYNSELAYIKLKKKRIIKIQNKFQIIKKTR